MNYLGWVSPWLLFFSRWKNMWVFPKIVGFPPKSSIFNRVFHYKPLHFGIPLFLETPMCFLCFMDDFNLMLIKLQPEIINYDYDWLSGKRWVTRASLQNYGARKNITHMVSFDRTTPRHNFVATILERCINIPRSTSVGWRALYTINFFHLFQAPPVAWEVTLGQPKPEASEVWLLSVEVLVDFSTWRPGSDCSNPHFDRGYPMLNIFKDLFTICNYFKLSPKYRYNLV